ncbi:hypothetical protein AZI86_00165 [Bdellovibrio bacteriovorus]|uniref:Uncharacterized protein n=1 Tax=Bdellovibrio bacteriovorus TaxID=959 RepID=A0A150WML8_BDEBC|nr:hypothetical protein [Bdellovibrio bacteriovorus]KYG65529.1 hypothetical protein AZI86_00165 [Bdellovibrio bacteriovorus]
MKTRIALILASMTLPLAGHAAGSAALEKGRALFNKGSFANASFEFFKENSPSELTKGRYGFGLSLYRLKLPHLASIPMMTVATQAEGKLQKKALDTLVKISYETNDNTLLHYAINKLSVEDLEETSQEVFFNRLADYNQENGKYDEALRNVDAVLKKNPDNEKAIFTGGLVYLKKDNPIKAQEFFKHLASSFEQKAPNDEMRGLALANYARALYQGRNMAEAENIYRQIPKDHSAYRKVQMELAWTLFRGGKIRSALSSLQTLHTPFYENFYDPESFILRAIILIFACQGDEAMKAVKAFQKNFAGLDDSLTAWLKNSATQASVIAELQAAQANIKDPRAKKKSQLPFFVVRTLMDEQPLRGLLKVKADILTEQQTFLRLFKTAKNPGFQNYAKKAYQAKLRSLDKNIARVFKARIENFQKEYRDLDAQVEFLQYEILEEKKRASKAKLTGPLTVDANEKRSFYVQNGFRYWPFTGEYWIDEIGNYQYLGVNRCED